MAVSATTLTLISIGLGLAGAAVSTTAAISSANYQAQVAQRNAEIGEANAQRAIARSQQLQIDQDRKTAYLLGQQEADQGASGLALGGRSFIMSRKAARELGRLDALNVRQAGELEAYNFKVMSADSAAAASFAESQVGFSALEGFLSAGSSVIGGSKQLMDQGYFNTSKNWAPF